MIEYCICPYGEFAGRPMVRVMIDDEQEVKGGDSTAEAVMWALKNAYNPSRTFVHQFTEQQVLLCFDGVGKFDPMNYQLFIIYCLTNLSSYIALPSTILLHTAANIPLERSFREFFSDPEGMLFSPFFEVGGRELHFVINLQTFGSTAKYDLVRTDIIKSYICDIDDSIGSVNMTLEHENAWPEILAYTAILQSKLGRQMLPVWIYPTTEELAKQSMLRGFNTGGRETNA